ncbi:MAG: pyridoxal-dependent decarboxylase [Anaerolineae bacterium]
MRATESPTRLEAEPPLVRLSVARNHASQCDMRTQGVRGCPRPLAFYASAEAHSSIDKGLIVLGLGTACLHKVPSGSDFQIDVNALSEAIARDRAEGWEPACVVGCAGTTDTGAFDDLVALADLCEREGLWFHVDGAFGAWAALAPETRHLVAGMERADSLALDLHKWMYMPYEIGCALVRDEAIHGETFSVHPAYLAHADPGASDRGIAGGDLPWFSDYTFQLSRGFRALKAWMSIKEHGVDRYARLVAQNVAQARYLADLVEADPELELAAPVPLNVVAYRYVRPGMGEADLDDVSLDALNRRILAELQERGIAVPTGSTVRGHAVIHVAITNHRTRREDLALLARETVRLGRELSQA